MAPQPPPSVKSAPAEPEPKKEAARPAEPGVVAFLYKGSRVTGQLSFQGPARIDGSVDGEIHCDAKLTIGEGAEIRAKISGQIVVIKGRVEANVTAKEKIELLAPARLYGNIETPRLIITEGVVFDGDCSMGVAGEKAGVASSRSVTVERTAVAQAPVRQADSK